VKDKPGDQMSRIEQLSLNFEVSPDSVSLCQLTEGQNRRGAVSEAKILSMPSRADRADKQASEREARLLERVLRRAYYF